MTAYVTLKAVKEGRLTLEQSLVPGLAGRSLAADPRGDARRRAHRRGRDPEPAHDQVDPARLSTTPRSWSRSEARSTCPLADFAKLNEQRAEGGGVDLRQPAQLRGGLDSPARSRDRPQRGRSRSGATASAPGAAGSRRATARPLTGCARRGFKVNRDVAIHQGIDEVAERCRWGKNRREALDFEIDGVVVKVDDRGLQRELGVVGPRAALGGRLEVPADDGDHQAEEDRLERRAHRAPAALRDARAGACRRCHGDHRHPP